MLADIQRAATWSRCGGVQSEHGAEFTSRMLWTSLWCHDSRGSDANKRKPFWVLNVPVGTLNSNHWCVRLILILQIFVCRKCDFKIRYGSYLFHNHVLTPDWAQRSLSCHVLASRFKDGKTKPSKTLSLSKLNPEIGHAVAERTNCTNVIGLNYNNYW